MLHIKAVGDIAVGDCIIDGIGISSLSKKYGCDFHFSQINTFLQNSDLLLGNLEGTLSQRSYSEDLRLCGIPEMAMALKKTGFDVLSLANNHVLDHGKDIFNETSQHCLNAGILLCGLRDNNSYYSKPLIIRKEGYTIGILAYNWIGLEDSNHQSENIASIYDGIVNYTWNRDPQADFDTRTNLHLHNKEVFSDINKIRKQVDIVILMPHWGYEWTIYPPYGVVLEARNFIDAGVDIIIGSHPHVPQGFELYKNKLIIYSLGNFLFDSTTNKFRYGMVVDINWSKNGLINYIPTIIDRDNLFRPTLASPKTSLEEMINIYKSCAAISSLYAPKLLDDELLYREFELQYGILKKTKIIFLFKMLIFHPKIIKPLFKKIMGLLKLLTLRLFGKKVRW
jgi:gamma-polyglutamate biosynthesis protein CapA